MTLASEEYERLKTERSDHLHRFLNMAIETLDTIYKRSETIPNSDKRIIELDQSDVIAIVRKYWGAPVADARQERICERLVLSLAAEGPTTCFIWHYAHELDHALTDDLSQL